MSYSDFMILAATSVDWSKFFIVVGIMAGIGLIFSLLIILISKYCVVHEDPKIAEVSAHLCGANCGGSCTTARLCRQARAIISATDLQKRWWRAKRLSTTAVRPLKKTR